MWSRPSLAIGGRLAEFGRSEDPDIPAVVRRHVEVTGEVRAEPVAEDDQGVLEVGVHGSNTAQPSRLVAGEVLDGLGELV
jgi:hypothetical protein